MEKEIFGTKYDFSKICLFCGEPIAYRRTAHGTEKWQLHKDNCKRPQPDIEFNRKLYFNPNPKCQSKKKQNGQSKN